MPVKETAPNRLIVEGRDDKFSIIALTTRHGWDWAKPQAHIPYIQDAEGVDNALAAIAVTVRTYKRVGIVLDADLTLADRWNALRNRLAEFTQSLPASPVSGGTIVDENDKRVGIWLMPDNCREGKLEDFLAALIPPDDSVWPWVEKATVSARSNYGATFSELDLIKAKIHTWLAWQSTPGNPFGTALTAKAFAHDTPIALQFLNWMERLYTP